MLGVQEEHQSCVERVLQSETFRNAPSSRRLFRYLADRYFSGDADSLKEYTIGVDAFSKPEDYDPRQDSTVRIQIGRLRQKLAEYYEKEGANETLIIGLPKGRLRLAFDPRTVAEPEPASVVTIVPEARVFPWRLTAITLGALLTFSLGWITYSAFYRKPAAAPWSADLDQLWRPLINSDHPLVIAVGNPLFLQFRNKSLYRDLGTEKWEDLLKSPNYASVKQALGEEESRPVYYYAAIGEVNAAFLLGQRLAPRQRSISLVRSSQLQWQQMAGSNVLYLGPPRFFGDRLGSLPVPLEITETADGFLNPHPRPGEASQYKYREPAGFFAEDGEANVLITHTAGPAGGADVVTIASNSTFGRAGAVEALTDPAFARTLTARMRTAANEFPRYFQILLHVKYKGGVPTETKYVLHRELHAR